MSDYQVGDRVTVEGALPARKVPNGTAATVVKVTYDSVIVDLDEGFYHPVSDRFGWYFDRSELRRLVPDLTSNDRVEFEGGGMRDSQAGKPRFDLLLPEGVPFEEQFLTRFAVHMAKGAEKYAERNWEQFSDQESLDRAKASALRHMHQWLAGETDEDHAAAVAFNVMAGEHIKRKL